MLRLPLTLRRNSLSALVQAGVTSMVAVSLSHAATCTVNLNTDDPGDGATTGASATVTSATVSGTLRDCIVAANLMTGSTGAPTLPGMAITFDSTIFTGGTNSLIQLSSALPLLFNNTSIDASTLSEPVTIDGAGAHRVFFVSGLPSIPVSGLPDPDGSQNTTVSLSNLIIQNGYSSGGFGTSGGMGAGGALFVNKNASVFMANVGFAGNAAVGGNAGVATFAGGGGMGGSSIRAQGAGGGLGYGTYAEDGSGAGIGTSATSAGGGSFGGYGIGQISNAQSFGPGFGGGTSSTSGAANVGGIGGGGGGYVSGGNGGDGGFGGGGGSDFGNGGFGGGGGYRANGGFGGGGGDYGNGGFGGGGGLDGGIGGIGGGNIGSRDGGAAFGGAVFVRSGGTLTVQSTASGSIAGNSVTAGRDAAQAGTGLFLMTGAITRFDISDTYTISDSIGDDSAASVPPGNTYTPGDSAGATIVKQGPGSLILSGVNTYAGATVVSNGVLSVTGSVAASLVDVAASGTITGDGSTGTLVSEGTLAPGTTADPQGGLTTSELILEPGSLSCFNALGSSIASSYVAVNFAALIDGVARIDFVGSPSVGTVYTLVQAASITGTFSSFETNIPSLDGALAYNPTTVTFTVTASDVIFQNGFELLVNDSPCMAAFAN